MADKEKYMIKIEGELIEVTPDVYSVYFRMRRQERGQEEKKHRNAVLSYDALETDEINGAETLPDLITPGPEEQLVAQETCGVLHRAIAALHRAERELIHAIYFDGLSERDYAQKRGISQKGVNKQRRKILSKLKMFLNIMGSF